MSAIQNDLDEKTASALIELLHQGAPADDFARRLDRSCADSITAIMPRSRCCCTSRRLRTAIAIRTVSIKVDLPGSLATPRPGRAGSTSPAC